jgi:hypothetical protein
MRAAIAISVLAACSSATEQVDDDLPPTIEMTSPQRGTFSEATQITVAGRVVDDKPGATITVQGAAVEVNPDGSFSTTVTIEPGIALVETKAIDSEGQSARDVRAVLAGEVGPSDGSIKSQLGARLSPQGLATIASAVATAAKAIDFTGAAQAMNPVYNNTGCLGARIDVTSITLSNITATMAPKAAALDTTVNVANLVVRLNADYKVACIGGSTTITARATMARVRDDLSVALTAGKLRTAVPSPIVTLEGFTVDVGGVPSQIESLLRDKAREAAETRLAAIVKERVPALADAKLAELVAKPVTTTLLGQTMKFGVTPAKVELAATGLFVALDTSIVVTGGEGGTFASNPMPITSSLIAKAENLGVAVADDAVNQLFAGLWAAGAFDLTLSGDKIGVIAALLDDDVRTLDITMSLPPTMKTAGTALELSIGDLIVTAKDDAGATVQTFALSLSTTMVAGPTGDNRLVLTTTTPTVKAQVLTQSAAVDNPLDASELEGIITGVWGVVGGMADDALAKLPMPAIAGIQLGAPTVQGNAGYVVLDVGAP